MPEATYSNVDIAHENVFVLNYMDTIDKTQIDLQFTN